jgi:hypothetical protein
LTENIGAEGALHNLRIGREAFTAYLCGHGAAQLSRAYKRLQTPRSRADRGSAQSNINPVNCRHRRSARRCASRQITAEKRR